MRKIKDVLRLCWGQGVSKRQVARSCGISRPTVRAYLRRGEAAGLRWPLPAELDDGALERVLFPPSASVPDRARGAPDWSEVHRELTRPGVSMRRPAILFSYIADTLEVVEQALKERLSWSGTQEQK